MRSMVPALRDAEKRTGGTRDHQGAPQQRHGPSDSTVKRHIMQVVPTLDRVPTQQEFWPTITRSVGLDETRSRLMTEWTTTGVLSALVASMGIGVLLSPPEHASSRMEAAIGAVTGLGIMFSLTTVAVSTLLILQLNNRVTEESQKFFLRKYGWVILLNIITLMSGVSLLMGTICLHCFVQYSVALASTLAAAFILSSAFVLFLFILMNKESMDSLAALQEEQRTAQQKLHPVPSYASRPGSREGHLDAWHPSGPPASILE